MQTISLKTVKDCDSIFSNGSDVLLGGKNLWLFRADGTFVAKHTTIRNPSKAIFLPHNTVLVDGHGDGSYHYISLIDGEILWSSIKKGRKTSISVDRFAVSSDGMIVYDVYHGTSNDLYVNRIIPQQQKHDYYIIKDGLRVTHDVYCDENDSLCVLQSHLLVGCGDTPKRQNGILSISINQDQVTYNWKRWWQSNPEAFTSACGCDGKKILCLDFSVYDLESKKKYTFLDSTELSTLPKDHFGWLYDDKRKLLTIYFVVEKQNIVIDCQNGNIIARYTREDQSVGYQGCPVGDEFWTGTRKGISRLPFPNVGI